MKVLLDLDGVLTDFVAGMEKAHGKTYPTYNGEKVDWEYYRAWGMSANEFWEPTHNPGFWSELPWMHDGREILEYTERFFGKENICILTSPSLSPYATAGKIMWIQKNLPDYARRFLVGPDKRFCAHSNALLIDDNDKNIAEFRAEGGATILVPRVWNAYHRLHEEALEHVKSHIRWTKTEEVLYAE